jgi:hypothetical protein
MKHFTLTFLIAMLVTLVGCGTKTCSQCGLDPYSSYAGQTQAGAQVSFTTDSSGCGSYQVADDQTCGFVSKPIRIS